MKKFLIILSLLVFLSSSLFANDTYFYMAGGQLVPTKDGEVDIEMTEEVIDIVLEKDCYEVTVNFSFYNYGPATTLEIGFPFFCQGICGEGTISDFQCWTNGVETSFADYPLKKEWSTWELTDLENAFVRTIDFPSKKITKTTISYTSTYGRESPSFRIVKYLYGTGSSWKNSIGKMTIRIQNNTKYRKPIEVNFPEYDSIKYKNGNEWERDSWEIICTNIEPKNYTDCITLEIGDIFGNDGPHVMWKNDFMGYYKKLKKEDLFWYTKAQLRLLRNAIYAYHGYPFKSQDLIDIFEKDALIWGWYGRDKNGERLKAYPLDKNFSEDRLSEIEKYNVKLILEEENRRK